jgi:hypothetical protein
MSAARILLLKQGPARPDHIPDGSPDPSLDDPESGRKLVCRACGHEITYSGARMSMDGSHKHVFSNPAGYVFEIGCFRTAPGCAHQGPPSSDFTWFPGYSLDGSIDRFWVPKPDFTA